MKRMLWLLFWLGLVAGAIAQERPYGSASNNASGTITSGGTYQQVFAQAWGRTGCTVQNNSSNNMWVFFGAIASATHGTSVVLIPGQSLNCGVGSAVLTDQVSIDGTTAGAFYANWW